MSLLWTIVPPEMVFAGGEGRRPVLWRYRGRALYVAEDAEGVGTIVELLSTDPADFLNPALTPGRRIYRDLGKHGD